MWPFLRLPRKRRHPFRPGRWKCWLPRFEELEARYLLTATPAGGEFHVNQSLAGDQETVVGGLEARLPRSVAMDGDGDFVVAWISYGQGSDPFANDVYIRRFDPAGTPLTNEILVNAFTAGQQIDATVAMDADGDFVVVWSSFLQDGSAYGVFARRFNAAGQALDVSEFQVNETTSGNQDSPVVAMDADGDFVVAWRSLDQAGVNSGSDVYARRFHVDGNPLSDEFLVNPNTSDRAAEPAIAMDADGDFVVAWGVDYEPGYGVFARRFDPTGTVQGSLLHVNSTTDGSQVNPSVALDSDGDFVVTWTSFGQDNPSDINGAGVFAQRFNNSGAAQGGEFRVNVFTAGDQKFSKVAADADGDFVVTWTSYGQDPDASAGLYARQFTAAGAPKEITPGVSEFRANTYTTDHQAYSAAAMDSDGDFVITWTSFYQNIPGEGVDDVGGVFGQRYDEPADTAGPVVAGLFGAGDPVRLDPDELVPVQLSQMTVSFSENLNTTGGGTGTNSVTNPANWTLLRNTADVSFRITSVTFGFNSTTHRYEATLFFDTPLEDGNYVLTAKQDIQDLADNALDGNFDGTPGGNFSQPFTIQVIFVPVGPEFRVNATVADKQLAFEESRRSAAIDADGDFVVAWSSLNQDGAGYGVYARRYQRDGTPQPEGEFPVNTTTVGNQEHAAVAADADGDFVVTWQSFGQDGGGWGVYARRYNSAGQPLGNEFRVNTTTAGDQQLPTVALDVQGDFVIAWTGPDAAGTGVFARRFDAEGVALGNEFRVNTTTADNQQRAAVALDALGNFVVAWESHLQAPFTYGVYAQRYNAAGVAQGGEITVPTDLTGTKRSPAVSIDLAGNFVVVWQSLNQDGGGYGIYARRFSAAGAGQGNEFQVNLTVANDQKAPSVASDADGDFVIVWQSFLQDGSNFGVYARRYSRNGFDLTGEFRINSTVGNAQELATAALEADGDAVFVWTGTNQPGGNLQDVYAQRYDEPTDLAGPIVTGVYVSGDHHLVTENERLVQDVTQLVVAFSEDLSVAGGTTGLHSVTNRANWQLLKNGTDLSSAIDTITFGFNGTTNRFEAVVTFLGALGDADYQLSARQNIQDLAAPANALDGNFNGIPTGDFTRAFTVNKPIRTGPEFRVNAATASNQQAPAVGVAANGDFVVVWESKNLTQDGAGYGVYAQRYSASGAPQGGEFRVNTTTAGDQRNPAVAVDAAGDFVVVWEGPEPAAGTGVFAQRYNAAGAAQGGEFRVNVTTANNQGAPAVALDAVGDFVVTWQSDGQDGNLAGVHARRYNAAGAAQDVPGMPGVSEFLVNTTTADNQLAPAVGLDAAGDFVVVWQSYGQDADKWGVFAQRYGAAGVRLGPEFRVNSATLDSQSAPSVGVDADGDFVVVWESANQESPPSGFGIFAQRYDASGNLLGVEFPVNTTTLNDQRSPSVGVDADGDFVVAWESDLQDTSLNGVFVRRFNAAGVNLGVEFRANTATDDQQRLPAAAVDADGDFVVVWQSNLEDTSGYGVFAQRYRLNTPPTTTGLANVGVLEDAADTVIDLWAAFDDASDPDSALTFTVPNNTNPGLFSAVTVDNGTGHLTLDYAANANGSAVLTVRATDSGGLFSTTTFSVTVTPVNDPPVAVGDAGSTDEDTAVTVAAPGVLGNDSDIDSPSLTVTGAGATSAQGAGVTVNANGRFVYDPRPSAALQGLSEGATTTDTFPYTVTDGAGGTSTGTVTVTVTGRNEPPVAVDDTGSTGEATVLSVAAPGVLGNDTDPDGGDTLTVTGFQPTSSKGAVVSVGGDGAYTYDPTGSMTLRSLSLGQTTTDTFTYVVSDGKDGSTATVTVTVSGVNDPPTAVNDTGSANEDVIRTVAAPGVLANDTDPDAADTLTVTAFSAASAKGAVVSVSPTGGYTYNPTGVAALQSLAQGQTTTDTFTYTINDGHGSTSAATVTVTVTGANDPPTAGGDSGSTTESAVLTVPAPGVLVNDTDPDAGDSLTANSGVATSALGATVTVSAGGGFVFDPTGSATLNGLAAGETTTDTFTYTIHDSLGATASATVTITVTGVNDPPNAVNDAFGANEDTVLTVAASGVLSNDTDPDINGVAPDDTLTVTAANSPSAKGAVVAVSPDGSFTYDPRAVSALQALAVGQTTTDTFTYTVSDGHGASSSATVTITVTGANDAPTAVNDATSTDEDTARTVPASGVLGNDTDSDTADTLTVTSFQATSAKGATVTVSGNGSFVYDPTTSAILQTLGTADTAADTFTYTINDGHGGTASATVTVTVTGVNDPPVASDDTASTDEDSALTVSAPGVLANDTDPEGGPTLTVASSQAISAKGATVTVGSGGGFVYDPTNSTTLKSLVAGQTTTDTFTYTVSDSQGGTDVGTVTVTVTGANDPPTAVNDVTSTDEDTAITVPVVGGVLGNDTDPDKDGTAPDDTLTVTAFQTTSAKGAAVSVGADGHYTYDPTGSAALQSLVQNQTTPDMFTYTISDGHGATASATVTVTVTGRNDPPTAVNDTASTSETALVTVAAPGVLSNDTDPDIDGTAPDDTLTVTGFQAISSKGAAVTVSANGQFVYDPTDSVPLNSLAENQTTTDTFVGSSRVDLQACKLEYSIVSPK